MKGYKGVLFLVLAFIPCGSVALELGWGANSISFEPKGGSYAQDL